MLPAVVAFAALAAWIVRRNASGLFTEVGGDAVTFGVEEGAYRHLPPAT